MSKVSKKNKKITKMIKKKAKLDRKIYLLARKRDKVSASNSGE